MSDDGSTLTTRQGHPVWDHQSLPRVGAREAPAPGGAGCGPATAAGCQHSEASSATRAQQRAKSSRQSGRAKGSSAWALLQSRRE